jgi:hypothetical protein
VGFCPIVDETEVGVGTQHMAEQVFFGSLDGTDTEGHVVRIQFFAKTVGFKVAGGAVVPQTEADDGAFSFVDKGTFFRIVE